MKIKQTKKKKRQTMNPVISLGNIAMTMLRFTSARERADYHECHGSQSRAKTLAKK